MPSALSLRGDGFGFLVSTTPRCGWTMGTMDLRG